MRCAMRGRGRGACYCLPQRWQYFKSEDVREIEQVWTMVATNAGLIYRFSTTRVSIAAAIVINVPALVFYFFRDSTLHRNEVTVNKYNTHTHTYVLEQWIVSRHDHVVGYVQRKWKQDHDVDADEVCFFIIRNPVIDAICVRTIFYGFTTVLIRVERNHEKGFEFSQGSRSWYGVQ